MPDKNVIGSSAVRPKALRKGGENQERIGGGKCLWPKAQEGVLPSAPRYERKVMAMLKAGKNRAETGTTGLRRPAKKGLGGGRQHKKKRAIIGQRKIRQKAS